MKTNSLNFSPTRILADFATRLKYDHIPPEVISHAKLCLLDSIGCALYGAGSPEAKMVAAVARDWSEKPEASIWGHGFKTACANAALTNGTMVDSFTLDDSHRGANVHPSAAVVPTAISVAEKMGPVDGKDLLTAIVAGYETAIHVGMSMCPSLQMRGYHPVGSVGGFGAAAAAGKLLGLKTGQMVHAFGIVGTQGGGLMAGQYDSMVKRMHAGKAAQNGVFSALLARQGFKGIANVLEAEYGGFCSTLADEFDIDRMTKGLGTDFETLNIHFRRYSCSGAINTAVDAIRKLQSGAVIEPGSVEKVIVKVSEVTVKHNGWPYTPATAITAQSNMGYGVAVALLESDAFVDQFTESRLIDPEIIALTRRVEVLADKEITDLGQKGKHGVKIEIYLENGRCINHFLDKPKAVSSNEVVDKFMILTGKVMERDTADKIIELVMALDKLPEINPLIERISE